MLVSSPANADRDDRFGQEGQVGFEVSTSGASAFSNPPSAEAGYCDGNEDYPVHISRSTGTVRSTTNTIGIQQTGGGSVDLATIITELPDLNVPNDFEIRSVYWYAACARTAAGVPVDPGTEDYTWIDVPDQESIIPGLLEEVLANLPAPRVSFPDADREFGWLYVNAPMDFRIEPLTTVTRSATITNVTGSATGSVTATPADIVFDPGEPGVRPILCSYEDAIARYDIDNPGACSHRYSNSSAISPTGTFRATHAVVWEITSSAPLTINQPVSSLSQDIEVAEIQAIENR
ncbi:MAG: hypothetical protein AB8G26_14830 [Ilumatobacter sp.]